MNGIELALALEAQDQDSIEQGRKMAGGRTSRYPSTKENKMEHPNKDERLLGLLGLAATAAYLAKTSEEQDPACLVGPIRREVPPHIVLQQAKAKVKRRAANKAARKARASARKARA